MIAHGIKNAVSVELADELGDAVAAELHGKERVVEVAAFVDAAQVNLPAAQAAVRDAVRMQPLKSHRCTAMVG